MERLQKIISAAGVASRRKAEELITSGLVQVNGQTITELGAKADAGKDHIRVNGKLIKFSGHHVYILLNKPKGYVTTLSDPEGRPTIVDLLQGVKQRVYPVGRLDYASEGLLLLTNDGELANALTKAASHVPKTYLIKVSGQPSDAAIEQLRAGIELPDRKGIHSRTAPAGIQLVHKSENPWYEVTLIEGRNRQIRAMFEQAGHHVEKLKRVRYGPFTLDVHPGKHRNLTLEEVAQLRAAVDRGTGTTAEASVRPMADSITHPIERAESYIDAELREEERSPAKLQPVLAPPVKSMRSPKPKDDRGGKRPGAFGGDKFRKKGPHGVKIGRSDSPFQKRSFDGARGPARPSGVRLAGARPAATRPEWKKFGASGSGDARSTGVRPDAKKWPARTDATKNAPRLFGKAEPRPARTASGGRPDWKKPAAVRGGSTGAPRKWIQGAAAGNGKLRAFEKKPGAFGKPRSFSSRPDRSDSRPSRPSQPFVGVRREDSRGGRVPRAEARPGPRPEGRSGRPAAAQPGSDRKPFWQGADKRRPRKPKEEGDFERREIRGERPDQGERPRKPQGAGVSRPKFEAGRPSSKNSSSRPASSRPRSSKPGSRPGKNRR